MFPVGKQKYQTAHAHVIIFPFPLKSTLSVVHCRIPYLFLIEFDRLTLQFLQKLLSLSYEKMCTRFFVTNSEFPKVVQLNNENRPKKLFSNYLNFGSNRERCLNLFRNVVKIFLFFSKIAICKLFNNCLLFMGGCLFLVLFMKKTVYMIYLLRCTSLIT